MHLVVTDVALVVVLSYYSKRKVLFCFSNFDTTNFQAPLSKSQVHISNSRLGDRFRPGNSLSQLLSLLPLLQACVAPQGRDGPICRHGCNISQGGMFWETSDSLSGCLVSP